MAEAAAVRQVADREAAVGILRRLYGRYAAGRGAVREHGAEWAVASEEISKHAERLAAGLARGGGGLANGPASAHGGMDQ